MSTLMRVQWCVYGHVILEKIHTHIKLPKRAFKNKTKQMKHGLGFLCDLFRMISSSDYFFTQIKMKSLTFFLNQPPMTSPGLIKMYFLKFSPVNCQKTNKTSRIQMHVSVPLCHRSSFVQLKL